MLGSGIRIDLLGLGAGITFLSILVLVRSRSVGARTDAGHRALDEGENF